MLERVVVTDAEDGDEDRSHFGLIVILLLPRLSINAYALISYYYPR